MTEFWNSDATQASWHGLQELSKEIDFVLIGGWAIYLHTKLQKSKDIDIIIDYETLRNLEGSYKLIKNERLKKYEIKLEKYDIDIYLPNYSTLTIPPRDILSKFVFETEGFRTPTPEALMALKLGAAADRINSLKGRKDAIDILGLLFGSGLEIKKLRDILTEYDVKNLMGLLMSILGGFDRKDLKYLEINESKFSKLRREYTDKLKNY